MDSMAVADRLGGRHRIGSACRAHLLAIVTTSGSPDPAGVTTALLAEGGTLAQVLGMGRQRLLSAARGDGAAVDAVLRFRAAMRHALRVRLDERPVLSNWSALLDYIRADMAHGAVERSRVLHLNTRNILIRDELMGTGTIDQVAVYVREVLHRAMELGSASLILVHNHPSGDLSPSRADVDITRMIIEAGKWLNVAVHDHLIVGERGHVSLRAKGLI